MNDKEHQVTITWQGCSPSSDEPERIGRIAAIGALQAGASAAEAYRVLCNAMADFKVDTYGLLVRINGKPFGPSR